MKKFSLLLLFFIGLCASDVSRLCAQATGGTISGTLSDSTGAPRPNATITLENVTTGQRITATTDNHGFYRIEGAPAGRYRVVSTATATSGTPAQEVTITTGSPTTVNLTMASGPATDTFMTAETVPTRLSPATLQNTYSTQSVQYLPQPNHVAHDGSAYGAYNLSLQTEGVNPSTFNVGSPANAGPSVVGERPMSNNYHIDGIDNNNKVNPGPLVYVSNEATSEFSLFHNQPSPNFGHSSGGKFNSTIRNGSNGVHGQIYDYLQNRNLNARDQRFSNLGINGDLPGYDQNRLGGSLGLPVLPSKLFFFGNFEYIPLRTTEPFQGVAFAPTAAGLQALRGVSGVSATNLGILSNALGTSVGPAVSTTTINGVTVPVGQIQSTFPLRMEQYMGTGAVDFTPWEKDRVSLRYVHNEMNTNNAFPGGLSAFATSMKTKSLLASGSYYHTFFNAVTNELRFGYNRYTGYSPLNNTSGLAFSNLSGFPNIQIGGASNFSLGQQFGTSLGAAFNTYHLADGLSMRVHGHDLRFGFDGRRYVGRYNSYASNLGSFGYSNLGRFIADLPPDVFASQSFFNTGFSPNMFLLNGYFQDTYNFKHSVSVDLGIRYEYSTIPTGIANQRFNTSGVTGLLGIGEPRSSTNNWGPYVGFAVSPFHNYTVLRAGAGVFFDTLYGYQNIGMFAPGLGAIAYGNTASNTPGFLANGGLQNPAPNSSNLTPSQARASTTSWFGNQRTPYSLQWNAAWQQAIWRNFTVEFKYMGMRGYHQPVWQMLNAPGTLSATNSLALFYNTPTQAQLNSLPVTLNQLNALPSTNPLIAAGFTNPVVTIAPDANSWYHGATVSLDHHFTGGFQFKGNYTWSHLIDDATGTPLDLMSTARIRANSLYDRRHVASATALWDVGGAFRNSYNWVRNVLADFTLGGTYTFASGGTIPIAANGFGVGGFGTSSAIINPNGIAGTGSGVIALRNSAGNIVGYQATNPNAQFIAGAPGLFAIPNRAGLTLDDINSFDVTAVKRFNFAERASIEFRGDAYNLLNKQQFTGTSATAIGSRYLMNLPGFLNPTSAGFGNFGTVFPSNARTLQVAARLTF